MNKSITLAVLFLPVYAHAEHPLDDVSKTEVIHFVPKIPNGPTREGEGRCLESTVSQRPDAWECFISIPGVMFRPTYDPCFSVLSNPGIVVCYDHPPNPGFVLKLAEPLPNHPPRGDAGIPWIMELADGLVCVKDTARGGPAFNPRVWPCSSVSNHKHVGVLGDPKPGKVWTCEEAEFPSSDDGMFHAISTSRRMIAIKKVWK